MAYKAIFRYKEYQAMIEDVFDAVRWLREHGIEVNDNTVKEDNYEASKPKGYTARRRTMANGYVSTKDS